MILDGTHALIERLFLKRFLLRGVTGGCYWTQVAIRLFPYRAIDAMELRQEHTNGPSIWTAMDRKARQVIACYRGHHRRDQARELWGSSVVKDSAGRNVCPRFLRGIEGRDSNQAILNHDENGWKTYCITRSHMTTTEDICCLVHATQSVSTSYNQLYPNDQILHVPVGLIA
jgi:IS1 family transposase